MAKPSEGQNVEVGAPLAAVVGGAGSQVDVVGRKGGALLTSTMQDLAMMSMVVNMAQTMGALNRSPMEPGTTTVAAAIGTNADAYAKSGSEFASTMVDNMVKFGVVTTLFSLANMNSGPTPEEVKMLQEQEEQRKAAIALDQATKAEGIAEEDRRKTATLQAPKM